jgi:hypothetical protein
MLNPKVFPYMCFVRFDLIVKEFDAQFNVYFDDHIRELAERVGYGPAWRTSELRGADNEGLFEQEYQQIYTINDPELFQSFPHKPQPALTEKIPFRRDMSNWGRVFYRLLGFTEKDVRPGRCLARMEVTFKGSGAKLKQFEADHEKHMRRVAKLPGVHRAWQMKFHPHKGQILENPAGNYMTMFEIDAPENIFDPSLNADRIIWEGKYAPEFAGRHFAKLRSFTPRSK